MKEVYKYTFEPAISLEDVEASLVLSIVSIESLRGTSQVRLDVQHLLDCERRSCVIDASTETGKEVNRIFVGYLLREFGEDAFEVQRIDERVPAAAV